MPFPHLLGQKYQHLDTPLVFGGFVPLVPRVSCCFLHCTGCPEGPVALAQLRHVWQAAEHTDAGTLSDCRAGVCRQDVPQALSTWPVLAAPSRTFCSMKYSQLPMEPTKDVYHF